MKRGFWVAAPLFWVACQPSCPSETLQRMEIQEKYKAYSENPMFEDGRAMRPLVAGTVPRERLTALAIPGGGDQDAGYVEDIPVEINPEMLARGRKRFDITCATCHGVLGDGNSMVARNMSQRPPPSLHQYADRPAGFIYDVVSNGYGLMAGYANEIPPADRWAVVAYMRALDRSQFARPEQAPENERRRLEETP